MPADVLDRDALLAPYDIGGLTEEPELRDLAELATQVCAVPYAVVNLISEHFQHQVAAVGLSPSICAREDSMCAVSIVAPEPVEVPDASRDPRFAANPFVTGRRGLDLLAHQAVTALELRRSGRALAASVRELTEARAELLRSNSALAAFAGQVGHDLRNPLAGVTGFLELLADQPAVAADVTASTHVDRALGAAGRMRALVDDLLDYARVGGGLRADRVDLGTVLDEVLDDAAPTGVLDAVDLDVGPLPTVRGDGTQLRAVLQNVLTNALRFARPDRRPRLRVRAHPADDRWLVEIADNGIGIPPERREEAFTLLRQVHEQGTVAGGCGIGLATCRRIIAAHGGTIGLDDGLDGGTTVWFTLPAA